MSKFWEIYQKFMRNLKYKAIAGPSNDEKILWKSLFLVKITVFVTILHILVSNSPTHVAIPDFRTGENYTRTRENQPIKRELARNCILKSRVRRKSWKYKLIAIQVSWTRQSGYPTRWDTASSPAHEPRGIIIWEFLLPKWMQALNAKPMIPIT